MNTLTTTHASAPTRPLSAALTAALHLAETGGLRYGVHPDAVSEARELLRRAQTIAPATAEMILAWLTPVIRGIGNTPTEQEARDRAEAIAFGCQDLPAGLFTEDALRAGVQKWKYLPTTPEVRDVVARDYLARKRLLEAVAHAPGAPPINGPHERTAEEIAAVTATMTAWRAERAARKAAEPKPEKLKVKPSYLTPAQLAAVRAGGKVGERVA